MFVVAALAQLEAICDMSIPRAVEEPVTMFLRHLGPGFLGIDAQRFGQAVVDVPSPFAHRAEPANDRDGPGKETHTLIRNEQFGSKRIAGSKSITLRAHALRAVEAKHLRAGW